MTLNNYKIIDDGIWISKKELEQMWELYCRTAGDCKYNWVYKDPFRYPFYTGKANLCIDILKHFDDETSKDM